MLLPDTLTTIGLTPEQTQLYLSLLEHGPQTAGKLAQTTKVQRTYIYRVAEELIAKGLVTMEKKEHTTLFTPQSPDHLLTQAETAKARAVQAQTSLEEILPVLKQKYSARETRPAVTTYDGPHGLKQIYEDTLKVGKPIYALVLPMEVDPTLLTYLRETYRVKRAKLGIHASVIAAANGYAKEYQQHDEEFHRTTRLVPEGSYPFQHEIDIYGDKVAFINYRKDTPLFGVVIDHVHIARTMKAFFDLAWLGAEKISQKT